MELVIEININDTKLLDICEIITDNYMCDILIGENFNNERCFIISVLDHDQKLINKLVEHKINYKLI
jgi:hypothetical protein